MKKVNWIGIKGYGEEDLERTLLKMDFDFGFEVGGRVVVFCFLYWSSKSIYSKPLLVRKEKN